MEISVVFIINESLCVQYTKNEKISGLHYNSIANSSTCDYLSFNKHPIKDIMIPTTLSLLGSSLPISGTPCLA